MWVNHVVLSPHVNKLRGIFNTWGCPGHMWMNHVVLSPHVNKLWGICITGGGKKYMGIKYGVCVPHGVVKITWGQCSIFFC